MPGIILKNMLSALCSSGAEFCHAQDCPTGQERGPEESLVRAERAADFQINVSGGKRFQASPEGDHPYYPPERHPGHVEIILPEGPVDFLINGSWHLLPENRVHILLPNTLHTERHCNGNSYTLFWLTCLPGLLTLHRTSFAPKTGYAQSACRVVITPPMVHSLWQCGNENPVNESHYFSLLVQCLDFAVTQQLTEHDAEDYHSAILSQLREYLKENIFRPVSLDELAQMAHCSSIHLSRLFLQRYGIPIHKYVSSLRLDEAKILLADGSSVGMAARSTGFSDSRYFSRFFRQHTGMTPSEFQLKSMRGK